MDLSRLSRQELERLVEEQIEKGNITNAFDLRMSSKLIDAVNLYHTFFCLKDHDSGECKFYIEEPLLDVLTLPEHRAITNILCHLSEKHQVYIAEIIQAINEVGEVIALIEKTHNNQALFLDLLKRASVFNR